WVTLILDAQSRDRHGQLLAYAYVGTRFVNAELVHQGYAVAATYPPNTRYQEYFLGLEQSARVAGRGLWADSAALAYYRPHPAGGRAGSGSEQEFSGRGPRGGWISRDKRGGVNAAGGGRHLRRTCRLRVRLLEEARPSPRRCAGGARSRRLSGSCP